MATGVRGIEPDTRYMVVILKTENKQGKVLVGDHWVLLSRIIHCSPEALRGADEAVHDGGPGFVLGLGDGIGAFILSLLEFTEDDDLLVVLDDDVGPRLLPDKLVFAVVLRYLDDNFLELDTVPAFLTQLRHPFPVISLVASQVNGPEVYLAATEVSQWTVFDLGSTWELIISLLFGVLSDPVDCKRQRPHRIKILKLIARNHRFVQLLIEYWIDRH